MITFNNKKKATIPGKGVLNNFISELIMTRLNDINIPNHFIKVKHERTISS